MSVASSQATTRTGSTGSESNASSTTSGSNSNSSNSNSTNSSSVNSSTTGSTGSNRSSTTSGSNSNSSNSNSTNSSSVNSSTTGSNTSSTTTGSTGSNASSTTSGSTGSNTSSTNSKNSNASSNTKSTNANTRNNSAYSPDLPHLLRIGDTTWSEYIELANGPIQTAGAFNKHSIGGPKELRNLYGIMGSENTQAMQKVFGICRLGQTPPIDKYLKDTCKFPEQTVAIQALKRRVETLNESVALLSSSDSVTKRRNQQIKAWLEKTIKALETASSGSATKDCEVQPPMDCKKESGPGVLSLLKSVKLPGFGKSDKCPCLTDPNTIRDLVYIYAILQGKAIPDVQSQLTGVSLEKLIEMIRESMKGKNEGEYKILLASLNALEMLAKLRGSANTKPLSSADCSEKERDIFVRIYKLLYPSNKNVPTDIKLDDLLNQLKDVIDNVKSIQGKQEDCDELRRRISELETELGLLRARPEGGPEGPEGPEGPVLPPIELIRLQEASEAEIRRLQAQVEDLQAQLTIATDELTRQLDLVRDKDTEIASAKEKFERLKTAFNGAVRLISEKMNELTRVRSQLDTTQKTLDDTETALEDMGRLVADLERRLADKQRALDAKTEETDSLQAEVDDLRGQLAAKQAELDTLKQAFETAKQEYQSLEEERDRLIVDVNDQAEEIQRLKDQFEVDMAEIRRELSISIHYRSISQALIKQYRGQIESLLTKLDEKERDCAKQRDELEAMYLREGSKAEETIEMLEQQLESLAIEKDRECEEALAALRAEVKRLRAQLAAKEEESEGASELAEENARLKERIAELEAEIAGLREQQQTARNALVEQLEAKITTLEADLEAAKALNTTKDGEVARLTAALQKLEKELAELKQKNAEQATTIAGHEATIGQLREQIEDLERQLAEERAKLVTATTAAAENSGASQKALEASNTRIAELEATIRKLEETLAAATAASDAKNTEIAELKATSASKNTTIADLRGQLASAQSSINTQKTSYEQQIAALKAELTASQARAQELTTNLTTLNQRIQDLLTLLLVEPDLLADAQKVLDGSKTLAQAKATFDGRYMKGNELCQLFGYFTGILNTFTLNIFSQFETTETDLRRDIFTLYGSEFVASLAGKDSELLQEISLFLQLLFTAEDPTIVDSFPVEGTFPLLQKAATSAKPLQKESLASALGFFGSLSDRHLAVQDGKLVLAKGTTGLLFITLVVKYIQLVKQDLVTKYGTILDSCGLTAFEAGKVVLSESKRQQKALGDARAASEAKIASTKKRPTRLDLERPERDGERALRPIAERYVQGLSML